jgi:hypothetical protein
MNTLQSLANRQPLKFTITMRSPRSFFAALVLLLAIPIALLFQIVLGIEFEITLHILLALTAGLVAFAVFDFELPRGGGSPGWAAWRQAPLRRSFCCKG